MQPVNTTSSRMSRKQFLRGAAMVGLSGPALASLLSGCASDDDDEGAGATSPPSSATSQPTVTSAPSSARSGLAQIAVTGWNVEQALDPAMGSGVVELIWGGLMYDTLITMTDTFEIEPGLAESWEISPDATEFVYTLRDAEFHDGQALTAADVVHTFTRLLDPALASPSQATLATYLDASGITAEGDKVVKFTLKSPNAFFPVQLANYNGRVVPSGWTSGDPIGTGPFRYKSFTPGQVFEADANPGYWVPDRPLLEGVRLVNVPEDATRVQSVLSGDSHLGVTIQPVDAQQVEAASNAKLLRASNAFFPVIVVRAGLDPALDNPEVTRALKMMLDRPRLLDTVQLGYGTLGSDMPVPTGDVFFPETYEPVAHDPDEAARLLEAAGVDEITIFTAPVGPGVAELPVAYADLARAAGLTVNIERVPADTYWSTAYLNEPVFMSYWARQHASTIVPQSMQTDGVWNETAYSNPAVDEAIQDAAATGDEAEQKRLYSEALTTFADEAGWLIPYWTDSLWPAKAELEGVRLDWVSLANMRDATLS